MFRLYCILIGYAFGLISNAYIYGKIKGIDIRNYGSGNAGTTNTLRTFGKRASLLVLVMDILKAVVPIVACSLIFEHFYPGNLYLIRIWTALGVVLGHDFPFYLKFKGGKGIAVSWGSILCFNIFMIPAELAVFFGIFFMTHFVSLASIFFELMFLVQTVIFGEAGFFEMTRPALLELYAIVFVITGLAIFSHRKNIKRLRNNTEKKVYVFSSDNGELRESSRFDSSKSMKKSSKKNKTYSDKKGKSTEKKEDDLMTDSSSAEDISIEILSEEVSNVNEDVADVKEEFSANSDGESASDTKNTGKNNGKSKNRKKNRNKNNKSSQTVNKESDSEENEEKTYVQEFIKFTTIVPDEDEKLTTDIDKENDN